MTVSPKKILLIQVELMPSSGANAVSAWVLEALKQQYDITLLSWMPVNLKTINHFYGTELEPSDLKILLFPQWLRHLVDAVPGDPWHFQGYCIIMRWCKIIGRRYDILISCNDETDFGVRGIQYIHYPYQHKYWSKSPGQLTRKNWVKHVADWLETNLRPWRITSGFSLRRMKENLTLVNSQWTCDLYRKVYGVGSEVVYPPVPGNFPSVPWEKKENGFVCIGRISTEKETLSLIDILTTVRTHCPDIHLHIIGSPAPWDPETYDCVKRKVSENTSWIFLHENVSRVELTRLVSRHRYGIHGMKNEHFGIGVAEMLRGGCIIFVPDGGGQVEIVGGESRLLYRSSEEAVQKILNVVRHPEVQTALKKYLNERKELFSSKLFVQRIQEIVRDFSAVRR